MLWGYLVHISYNMWNDRTVPPPSVPRLDVQPYLRCDDTTWTKLIGKMAAAGVNTAVLDLGDAIQYASHPEIAVENAWPRERLRDELARLRDAGIEPLPKLNFSATHDIWLGPYARQVSTPAYYTVCRDLIAEVCALFDGPRLFHLGMDEECYEHQRFCAYVVIRQHELWWHDLGLLLENVRQGGARPWVWSDAYWSHPEPYAEQMPKDVLQSNWHYDNRLEPDVPAVAAYDALESLGFDQVPTGSNYSFPENFEKTVAYCREKVNPTRLKGFLQTVWKPTLPDYWSDHEEALDGLARAKASFAG